MKWGPLLRDETPAVAGVVNSTAAALRECLGGNLLGLYLSGSLSMGDFDVNSSDIDLVVVLRHELDADSLAGLRSTHARLREEGGWWATRLEAVYLPVEFCRTAAPGLARHYLLKTTGELVLSQPRSDWVVQMHIAREYGPRLAGSEAAETIVPIAEQHLRASVFGAMPFIARPDGELQAERTLALHVLSACRLLYTRMTSMIATKSQAAAWAKEFLRGEWNPVVDSALAGRGGHRLVPCGSGYALVDEVHALIAAG